MSGLVKKLSYSEFYYILEHNNENPTIEWVKKTEQLIQGEFTQDKGGGRFYLYVPVEDEDVIVLLRKNVKEFEVEPPRTLWANLFYSLGPIILFIIFLSFNLIK